MAVEKRRNSYPCDSMDGPGEYYAEQNKPERATQIPCDLTHRWNLINKIKPEVWMNGTE